MDNSTRSAQTDVLLLRVRRSCPGVKGHRLRRGTGRKPEAVQTKKNSRVLTRLRYLCSLGIRSECVVPALIPELQRLVPFSSYVFGWSTPDGRIANSLTSPLRPETLRYLSEHFDQLEADFGHPTAEVLFRFPPVVNVRRSGLLPLDYERTATYRCAWEPESIHWALLIVVRTADGVPLAQLQLFRSMEDPDFDSSDEQALETALPYLRRMLLADAKAKDSAPLLPDPKVGLAVLAATGQPLFVSARARALCVRAFNNRMPVNGAAAGLKADDPIDGLRAMQREVVAAATAGSGSNGASGYARRVSNAWGTFTIDWQPAEPAEAEAEGGPSEPSANWGVIIREHIPMPLLLIAEFEHMGLTDRQSEVCRRLIDGEATPQIAHDLGISRETLRDHVREVYRRAEVRDRDELIRRMLAAAC